MILQYVVSAYVVHWTRYSISQHFNSFSFLLWVFLVSVWFGLVSDFWLQLFVKILQKVRICVLKTEKFWVIVLWSSSQILQYVLKWDSTPALPLRFWCWPTSCCCTKALSYCCWFSSLPPSLPPLSELEFCENLSSSAYLKSSMHHRNPVERCLLSSTFYERESVSGINPFIFVTWLPKTYRYLKKKKNHWKKCYQNFAQKYPY